MKGRPRDPKRARTKTGHRRKPGEAVKLTVAPDPLVDEEPRALAAPTPEWLRAPETLPEKGREIWDRLVQLIGPGYGLKPMDVFGLEALVRQYMRIRQMGEIVDQYGVVSRTPSGHVVPTPFAKAERDATRAFLSLAEQYGLTTASRLRLGLMQLVGRSLADALEADLEG